MLDFLQLVGPYNYAFLSAGQYLQGQDVGYSTDRQLFAQRKVVPRNTRSHVASPALEWMAHIAGASVTA